jgi:hypothetical protein
MNTMDNAKVIKAIEKFAFHNYLKKLADAAMHKVTLFTIFSQTGAPNLSDPVHYLIIDDLNTLAKEINSGQWQN